MAVQRLLLIGLVITATSVRCWNLGSNGFSEDEIFKLQAIDSYRQLDFTANAEHPMLMKLAALGTMEAVDVANRLALDRVGLTISQEAALRLPSAIAGGLTTLGLFLLAEIFFGPMVGWLAAILWAFDVNAIAINRIAKEDSLLVMFLILAAWCYERGKRAALEPCGWSAEGQRWFRWAGAAFGLMAASKYMPYYFGLHVVFCRAAHPHPGLNRPDKTGFFAAMAVTFVAANFAVLLPQNWTHIARYTTEQLLPHTGYVFAGTLYLNQVSVTPWGVPSYFYVMHLLTKTPVPTLAALVAGLVTTFQHPRERGFVFLRVFFVFVLLPYSLLASKFVRYMLPLLAVLDMIAAVGVMRFLRAIAGHAPHTTRRLAAVTAAVIMIAGPVAATATSAPHYGLYRNAAARLAVGNALLFPHCELYDAGMREAVRLVAQRAAPGALVLSEAPRVVAQYAGRRDLVSHSVSHDGMGANASDVWVLVQDGRLYFENLSTITELRASRRADVEVRVGGVRAVQVFHLTPRQLLHAQR